MVKANGIIDPSIDTLMSKVDSKYALVTFAAQRARQINDYYTDLHDGSILGNVGPLVDCSVDDKPLTVALHEIAEDKLVLKQGSAAEAAGALAAEVPAADNAAQVGETGAADAAADSSDAEAADAEADDAEAGEAE